MTAARMIAVRKPVGVNCGAKRCVVGGIPPVEGGGMCQGVMSRIALSRLEEGLGHEGFECDKCHRRVKYIGGAS